MGHSRQHSFTGSTDHDFDGLSNNYLPKLNSSGTGITDSNVYDDGSNIAIGHISPTAKIHIKSNRTDSGAYSFKIKNSGDTEIVSIRDDGYTEIAKTGGQVVMGTANNYLDYYQNRLIQFSDTATFTGFHANRNGSGISVRASSANDLSLIESTGTMSFSTNWDNNFNNGGTLAMLINGDNQYIGIGMPTVLTVPGAKLNIRGSGNTGDGKAFLVENSDGTDMVTINNAGLSMFGTTSTASTFGGVVGAIHAELTVTDPTLYASAQAVTTTYNPTANASGYIRNFSTNIIKYGTYNAPYIAGNTSVVRNDSSSGTVTDALGYDSVAFGNGSGTTTNLFAYQGNSQIQDGATVTNLGGLKMTFGAVQAGTTVTNMYGLLVTSPQNTGGAVTNTYGVYIQSNTIGSSTNWGIYQDSTSSTNYLGGRTGIGASPNTGDRLSITAGSGLDGAINISAANLANNGYALLAQGSSSSSNYNGIWSDAQGGSNNNIAFRGSALSQAVTNNYGGQFSARNGSGITVGVYGHATGGDSVAASDSAGVIGVNSSEVSTNKKGVWGYLNSNVNNGTGYGGKFEAGNAGTNAVNYAIHGRANGSAASATNYAGYFQADGGSGAANYAIVTNGGSSGFGTTAPTDMVHINGSTGSTQLRLEQSHTPTSSGSTSGNIGSVAWDNNYFYMKTNLGWGRVAWDYNF